MDFEVTEADAGARLDVVVARSLGISRRRASTLCAEGAVRLDGRRAVKGQVVAAGQRIGLSDEAASVDPRPVPELERPLTVLAERGALLFVDKPSSWPSHPLRPGETGTLANAVVARFPECADASEDPREGGLCHRLDAGTSGVVMLARTREAWREAREAFGRGAVEKIYRAVCSRVPAVAVDASLLDAPLPSLEVGDEEMMSLPLRHADVGGRRVIPTRSEDPRGRPARSVVRLVEERDDGRLLVEVTMRTGVLHQVRAHLAALGAPLVGDTLYGGEADPELPGGAPFLLHGRQLSVTLGSGSSSTAPIVVAAPVPAGWPFDRT